MRFEITEQVTLRGFGELSVLVKNERIYAQLDRDDAPQVLFNREELVNLGITNTDYSVSVGRLNGQDIGLVCIDEHSDCSIEDEELSHLRQLLPDMSSDLIQTASRATQLASWLSVHQYCGRCGTKAELAEQDRAMVCPNCDYRMYPKLAPCVIGVVVRGDEILLANGVRHRSGIYTALAGFIEVGESAEQAFKREVKEEVGIDIKGLQYLGSQNWPFPHQLMLAFVAEYESGELVLDEREIVDAAWFKKTELPSLPGNYTIARAVIEEALDRMQ